MGQDFNLSKRAFLALAAAGGAAAALPAQEVRAQAVPTNARIVIIGAGAAGTALVNRLVRRLDGAQITLIDPRVEHLYQPGLTLVAAGLKPPGYVVSQTADWLPDGVTLLPERVAAVDPVAQTVSTDGGETLAYDFLVVAPGLILDHDAIEGFSLDMVGENGIGALYAGPDYAARTWTAAARFIEEGGRGIFSRPETEMKCAGAPLKHTFLIDDRLERAGNRGAARIDYIAPQGALFGVPIVAEKVRMLFDERDINYTYGRTLRSVDAAAKIATFTDADGFAHEEEYDYLHVIPPQRAPEFVVQSGLAWADRWTDQGWVECDPQTMPHNRYKHLNGDCWGVRKGKMEQDQSSVFSGRGYCRRHPGRPVVSYRDLRRLILLPLNTRIGRAMLTSSTQQRIPRSSFPWASSRRWRSCGSELADGKEVALGYVHYFSYFELI